jgi:hypothetical protein
MRERKVWTPPELARRYGVNPDKVVSWIDAGELAAMNLATTTGGRPRYKITDEAVQAFEARRAVVPAAPVRRRKRPPAAAIVRNFR